MTQGTSAARDRRVRDEAVALHRELLGVAPPAQAAVDQILRAALAGLDPMPYERLQSPHLRPSCVTWPVGR